MRNLFVALLLLTLTSTAIKAQEVLDRIIAIVDNEIILNSELNFQTAIYAQQRKLNPNDPKLREEVLKMLMDEKFIYAQAHVDSIVVSEDEIRRQLDYQVSMLIQQYGSQERVQEVYGMNLDKIRRELRDNVRKNIMVQKLQEKEFGLVEASRKEVEQFFSVYRDSIGLIPERVRVSHIFLKPELTSTIKEQYFLIAKNLLDSIKNGGDFAELAKQYSEDPGSAKDGGDLGFIKRGVLVPEFESVAYGLNEGELSSVVETQFGFHIIQLLERRGESIRARHILIKIKADDQADLHAIEKLGELRDSVVRFGKDFALLATRYSHDKETSSLGGKLGTFFLNQLDKNLLDIVQTLKEGEISFPRRLNLPTGTYGYHIVYLEKRTPEHLPNLDIDYSEIKKLADEYKKQKLYSTWIEELKTKIFWEIKL